MDTNKVLEIWTARPMTMRLERPKVPQCDIDFNIITVYPRYMDLIQYTELFTSPCNSLHDGIRKWQDMIHDEHLRRNALGGKLDEWSITINKMFYTFYGILPWTLNYSASDQTITTTARLGFDAYNVKEV